MIYLDANATTRPSAGVCAAVGDAMAEAWANPSSVHRFGQEARARVELARRDVAGLIGARPRGVTFTGSGTEAIDLAIRGGMLATGRRVVVTDRAEHAAVRDLVMWGAEREGLEVRWLPIDRDGVVDVAAAAGMIDASVGVVSVQWANNETGVIQPVEELGRLCRGVGGGVGGGVMFHCDGTQWVGKEPAEMGEDGGGWCDVLTFAPHKFHGPKGVGVLWARAGVRLAPMIHGTQEQGRRGGTENTPGIMGAGAAAREAAAWLADASNRERMAALRDRFEATVLAQAPRAVVNGRRLAETRRLWNTTNIAFPRLEAEALLLLLSEQGVCASAGAACSSGSLEPSPVLLAMGVPEEEAHGSVRLSLSRETTEGELAEAAAILAACVRRLGGSMTA